MFRNYFKISLLSIFTLSSCSLYNDDLEQLKGLYGGLGVQKDGRYWVIKININSEKHSIEYPLMSSGATCYGQLDYSHKSVDNFYFREKIHKGPCNDGTIYLTALSNDELEYNWENEFQVKLRKYESNDDLTYETTRLFEKYTKDKESTKDNKSSSSNSFSSEDTALILLTGAAVVGGFYCLFADCSGDDTSTASGGFEDDIKACENKYIGQRIFISSGKKNIWGDTYTNEYEVRGIGKTQMTVEYINPYDTYSTPKVFNLACSTYRFNPNK